MRGGGVHHIPLSATKMGAHIAVAEAVRGAVVVRAAQARKRQGRLPVCRAATTPAIPRATLAVVACVGAPVRKANIKEKGGAHTNSFKRGLTPFKHRTRTINQLHLLSNLFPAMGRRMEALRPRWREQYPSPMLQNMRSWQSSGRRHGRREGRQSNSKVAAKEGQAR